MLEARDRVGRPGRGDDARRRHPARARGTVGGADPGPDVRADRRARAGDVPHLQRRGPAGPRPARHHLADEVRTRVRCRGSPRSRWPTSGRGCSGSSGWRAGSTSTARGPAATPSGWTGRPSAPGSSATCARPSGRAYFEVACESIWAAEPERHEPAARALLRALGHRPRHAHRRRPRRPAGPRRRRLGARGRGDGRRARRPGPPREPRARGPPRRVRRPGRVPRRDVVRRVAGGRDAAADPGRPAGVRPGAAVLARPAHPAAAGRLGGQGVRDLRRAVLAGAGAQRPGRQRPRPGQGHLRQLAAVGDDRAC